MATNSNRLISLDAFRGFTITLMILVNNPGSWSYVIPPLGHAEWHGCTPTDLVFPFFLFIMGTAMAFSFSRRLENLESKWPLYRQIIKRSFILIFFGIFMAFYLKWDVTTLRIPGVLQRIGLCYLFASLIIINFRKREQIIWTIGLLLGYWLIMTLIPFSSRGGDDWVLGSNFAQYIDNIIIPGHMWLPNFDPEGLISTIPAIAQVLLGYFTGLWLRSAREHLQKTNYMFISGSSLIVLALIWEFWMPINKQLWTSSYVIYTTGIALHFLAISYWLIDIKGYTKFTKPFLIYGSNAILAYFASSMVAKTLYMWKFTIDDSTIISVKGFIFESILQPIAGNWIGSLLFPIIYILLWLAVLTWFYKKKIFIKI